VSRKLKNKESPGMRTHRATCSKTRRVRPSQGEGGFSLVELLIALLMTGVLATAGYGVYLSQHEGWIIQEQVSTMQQNARAGMHELEIRIRMAGYGIPGGFEPIYAANTNPDTITVLLQNEFECEATIEHAMPQPSSELRCDGHDVSCFEEDTWAYIYDPSADTGEFFYVTGVQVGGDRIQHSAPLSRSYSQGSVVMYLDLYKFYIDTTDTNHPTLMVKREGNQSYVYAEDIEDLQFRYGLANGVFVDIPPAASVVREVVITLTARTAKEDLQLAGEYRRRTITSDVKVRNLGL
jgi:prepilin-type N-terminal cleavage/methylation domain-containing protein